MARSMRDVVGTIGSTSVRLADWRAPGEAYQRRYVPVKPQDRFVSGQQFDFTADLEMRDWIIDDFSGGIGQSEWWDPATNEVRALNCFYPVGRALRLASEDNITQQSASDYTAGQWIGYAEKKVWSGTDQTIYELEGSHSWKASGVTTGAGAGHDLVSHAAPGDNTLYLSTDVKDIHKISDLTGSPTNAEHYATAAADPFAEEPILEVFDGRVFALDGNDLYEIDQSTTDTRTQVSSINAAFLGNTFDRHRLAASDVGLIWYVEGPDGYIEIWEYNVGSDTTDRIGRIPWRHASPTSIAWGLGFTWVSFTLGQVEVTGAHSGHVYYFRGSQTGTIGPMPTNAGKREQQGGGIGTAAFLIAGFVRDELLLVHSKRVTSYSLESGAFGQWGNLHSAVTTGDTVYAITAGTDCLVTDVTTSGGAGRTIHLDGTDWLEDETAVSDSGPAVETGRWHFGYPNVEKIFTEVTVDFATALHGGTDDEITLLYSVDGGSFSTHATTTSGGSLSTFTWTLSDNSTTVSGKDLSIRLQYTDRDQEAEVLIYRMMARATSAQSRREWQLILDASDSSGAGLEQNDVAWLQELEDWKTNKAVVQFTDPWQQKDEGTADTFDVIVEDVVTPPATHSADDQREAIVVLREVSLV